MRACFIKNKYYSDSGMEYIFNRLYDEIFKYGVTLETPKIYTTYPAQNCYNYDFAIIWDKDVSVVKYLERLGIKCFNCSEAIEICDDKEKTFSKLAEFGFYDYMPKTISAPLVYDVNDFVDSEFINYCIQELSLPIVVKQNVGSQGKQVYLAKTYQQLYDLHKQMLHIPHIFQKFLQGEYGSDLRVYTIGGKVVKAVKRANTTDFRSNISMGGKMDIVDISRKVSQLASSASKKLTLDYGSVDFMFEGAKPYIIEVNSNAYFKTIEGLGVDIGGVFAAHIMEVMQKNER